MSTPPDTGGVVSAQFDRDPGGVSLETTAHYSEIPAPGDDTAAVANAYRTHSEVENGTVDGFYHLTDHTGVGPRITQLIGTFDAFARRERIQCTTGLTKDEEQRSGSRYPTMKTERLARLFSMTHRPQRRICGALRSMTSKCW